MDSSVVVFVVLLMLMLIGAAVVGYQLLDVRTVVDDNKAAMVEKHAKIGLELAHLAEQLGNDIAALTTSTSAKDKDLLSRLATQQQALNQHIETVNKHLKDLDDQDVLTDASLTASKQLLGTMTGKIEDVVNLFNGFLDDDGEYGVHKADTATKLANLATEDARIDADVKRLAAAEVGVSQTMKRFKFNDADNSFSVCGVDSTNCKQLAFVTPPASP
jgi:hypothetical protein